MKQINFRQTIEQLRDTGFSPVPEAVSVRIPDARNVLWNGIRYFAGNEARWLPAYDEVAAWMADNQGRGLLCFGNCCGPLLRVSLSSISMSCSVTRSGSGSCAWVYSSVRTARGVILRMQRRLILITLKLRS